MKSEDIIKKYYFFKPRLGIEDNLIGFGLEVGPGWLPMIDELCSKLVKLIDEKCPESKETFKVTQVKEKFGGLRFYISSGTDEIYNLIDEYEEKSFTICETCGSGEAKCKTTDGGYWMNTLCDKCRKEKL